MTFFVSICLLLGILSVCSPTPFLYVFLLISTLLYSLFFTITYRYVIFDFFLSYFIPANLVIFSLLLYVVVSIAPPFNLSNHNLVILSVLAVSSLSAYLTLLLSSYNEYNCSIMGLLDNNYKLILFGVTTFISVLSILLFVAVNVYNSFLCTFLAFVFSLVALYLLVFYFHGFKERYPLLSFIILVTLVLIVLLTTLLLSRELFNLLYRLCMNTAGPSNSSGGATGGNTGGGGGSGPGGQPPHNTPMTPEQIDRDRKDRANLCGRAKRAVKTIEKIKSKLRAANQAKPEELRINEVLLSSPELRRKEKDLVKIVRSFQELKSKMVNNGISQQPLTLNWEVMADYISKVNKIREGKDETESQN